MLYKFYSFTGYTLDALANGSVYFSTRKQFNDPMDCNPPILPPNIDEFNAGLEVLADKLKNVDQSFKETLLSPDSVRKLHLMVENDLYKNQVKEISDSVGVFCLTKNPSHPLMWGHYADGHKGFCVGFDIPETDEIYGVDKDSFEGAQVRVRNIEYSEKTVNILEIFMVFTALYVDHAGLRNELGYLDSRSAESLIENTDYYRSFYRCFCMHHLTHKHKAWSYEEELRVLSWPEPSGANAGVRKLKHARVREVIFGARMPVSQRITVERLLQQRGVEYRQSIFSDSALALEFLPAW